MQELLKSQFNKLKNGFPKTQIEDMMSDKHGIYAYLIKSESGKKYYFCIVQKLNKYTGSILLELVRDAYKRKIGIISTVGEQFYRYEPRIIMLNRKTVNKKKTGRETINFDFQIGQEIKLKAPKPKQFKLDLVAPSPEPDSDLYRSKTVQTLVREFNAVPIITGETK